MTRAEWTELVKRTNASFPNRPVDPGTAAEWFEELAPFGAAEVWLAIRRCRRDRPFAPSLAQILEARAGLARVPAHYDNPSAATRTCADCATSSTAGDVEHIVEAGHAFNPYRYPLTVTVPCPGCRPVRARVLAKGGNHAMTLKTERDGWPEGWRREPTGGTP